MNESERGESRRKKEVSKGKKRSEIKRAEAFCKGLTLLYQKGKICFQYCQRGGRSSEKRKSLPKREGLRAEFRSKKWQNKNVRYDKIVKGGRQIVVDK